MQNLKKITAVFLAVIFIGVCFAYPVYTMLSAPTLEERFTAAYAPEASHASNQ